MMDLSLKWVTVAKEEAKKKDDIPHCSSDFHRYGYNAFFSFSQMVCYRQ
jgi:hypothetical protein